MRTELFDVLQICLGSVQSTTVEEAEVPLNLLSDKHQVTELQHSTEVCQLVSSGELLCGLKSPLYFVPCAQVLGLLYAPVTVQKALLVGT